MTSERRPPPATPPDTPPRAARTSRAEDLPCDYCGGGPLRWRKCKLICDQCRQINKSCADL
ncbi:MAG TPA: hypothetical protein VGJ96_14510 [Gemmatimonadaceae bacterium]